MERPKFSVKTIVTSIATILGLITGFFAIDARYNPAPIQLALEQTKTEIINEVRNEVAINRAGLLATMYWIADDLEFQIMQYELNNERPPRHLIDRHKRMLRDIEKIQTSSVNENIN